MQLIIFVQAKKSYNSNIFLFFNSRFSPRRAREPRDARRHDRDALGGAAADTRSPRDRTRETRDLEYHPARFSRSAGAKAVKAGSRGRRKLF